MRLKLPEIPPPKLISALRSNKLLPAIVFLPSRRKCDEAALEVAADKRQKTDGEKQRLREQIFDEYVLDNPEVKSHKHRKMILRAGVAAHHAGHLPAWKLLIEKMMSAGVLDAIFATSTVAAGVDFPARTVVISQADSRGNDGFEPIKASELQQMTGRAGRRGRDKVGFIILAPSPFQNPPRIAKLLGAPPDPLESQFRATYSSLLNLLDAFKSFSQVRDIAEKSFAFRETRRQIDKLLKNRDRKIFEIEKAIKNAGFDYTIEDIRGFERLTSARLRVQENPRNLKADIRQNWLKENVVQGRAITKGRNPNRFYLVLNVFGEKVMAMREDGRGMDLPLERVGHVFEKIYHLEESSLDDAFYDIEAGKNPVLDEPDFSHGRSVGDDALDVFDSLIEKFAADGATKWKTFLWEMTNRADFVEKTGRDVSYLKDSIWLPFENRARVLDHFGYLDFFGQKVTETGKWLADVRVDRPLLIGEAIKRGLFAKLETKQVAGFMAALAADSERNYGELYLSDKMLDVLSEFEEIVFEVSKVEWKNGVEPADELNFSAAAAAEHWAEGIGWNELVAQTKAEEGDLVRLLSRTGEALRQVANLKDSNAETAKIAGKTAEIILREPIR